MFEVIFGHEFGDGNIDDVGADGLEALRFPSREDAVEYLALNGFSLTSDRLDCVCWESADREIVALVCPAE